MLIRRNIALAVCACAVAWTSGCFFPNTQRWPPPMGGDFDKLPPGDAAGRPEGIEEVTVLRHADPVRVRPVGALQGQPLAFYDKRMRVNAGSSVIVSPGGRAEVLWPSGAAIVLYGQGVAWVGSTGRGEPMLDFEEVDRARIDLREGDRVRLMGGAELTGSGGPYVVERQKDKKLVVVNRSKADAQVAFREELFVLGPGQKVVLPLLTVSGAPIQPDPSAKTAAGPGFSVRSSGAASPREDATGLGFSASGESRLEGLGQRVVLQAGESSTFSGFEREPEKHP
ncbi:MAG TPA: hypothetical protein VM509_11965 [Planctomycetota bacterium]|nr:hypothetical protein [Planctomycetota bacterium]